MAQIEGLRALAVAAEGSKADNVKPLKGFDSGVMEIVLRHRGDAFRVIYALQIGVRFNVDRWQRKRAKRPLYESSFRQAVLQDRRSCKARTTLAALQS